MAEQGRRITIVAGNLSGGAPSGPGYVAWLASKDFDNSQFASFAVNVVDDAPSLRGHPDLPHQRVAFENNPTNQGTIQGGHGFLNSHIVGGFNDAAGTAYEDANGFNYGLGIVPWARVGVTAIFGPDFGSDPGTPTSWENTAYGQGARISSNSWGFPIPRYDVNAQEYDRIVRDAEGGAPGNQQLAIVFAAGNLGQVGEGSIISPGTAKNIITVGASENVRMTGADGCGIDNSSADSANDFAFFSSREPVNPGGGDGRVKPDIVALGTHIQAGVPQSNYNGRTVCDKYFPPGQTLYSWSSGTSQATPAGAGGAALVYQDFLNKGMEAPSPAMAKAVLMNSASYLAGADAGDSLPSNSQGMGLMNLGRAFDGAPRLLTDQTRTFGSSGETYRTCPSPKPNPASIFNISVRPLAVHIDGEAHRLQRSRLLLPTPAAALPWVPERPWQAINEFATCDNIQNLLCDPGGGRMLGDIEVHHTSALMSKYD